jgi:hypothetical protein
MPPPGSSYHCEAEFPKCWVLQGSLRWLYRFTLVLHPHTTGTFTRKSTVHNHATLSTTIYHPRRSSACEDQPRCERSLPGKPQLPHISYAQSDGCHNDVQFVVWCMLLIYRKKALPACRRFGHYLSACWKEVEFRWNSN